MKSLLIISNLVFAGILFIMSCNKSAPPGETAAVRPCPDCYDHTRTRFKGISTETATQISNDYKTLNQPKLIIDESITDANSIWFSMESLKNFIWKVEQEICRRGCGDNFKLGLRIYYGRYPAAFPTGNSDYEGLDQAFVQHHTVFMVPTFQDPLNNQLHHDFDPWHWGSNTCVPRTMSAWFAINPKPFLNDPQPKSLIFSVNEDQFFRSGGGLTPAMNHGGLIPPYSDEGNGY